MSPSPDRSPRTGDRVRAVQNRRGGPTVEGTLKIGNIDMWGKVTASVDTAHGTCEVIASSIEVLDPCGRKVRPRPGVRVADLAEAEASGLLLPPVHRVEVTWDDLEAELFERARPLLEAGWEITGSESESDGMYGDSVFLDFRRGDVDIELEYYDHGQLVAYPVVPREEMTDEPAEPYFSILRSSVEAARSEFEAQGWLGTAADE